eukprot:2238946-Lingulodinium_polyedra.AAC.1
MAFEPATIRGALRAWASLCAFAGSSTSSSAPPSAATVVAWLAHCRTRGATVPRASFDALAWLVRHLDGPRSLLPAVRPPARTDAQEPVPAEPAEVEVVLFLETLRRRAVGKGQV